MELVKVVFVCVTYLCLLSYCNASVINGTSSNNTEINSDATESNNEHVLESAEHSEKEISDKAEVVSDTSDQTPDARELTPEDEDMVILKMQELGGILNAKDIADIKTEEQALEDLDEDIPKEEDLKFEPIPMPTNFDSYDRNGDGFIEMQELIDVTGAFENVEEAFKVCDTNNDKLIDREEFEVAPWDLAGKPPKVGIIGQ